MRQNREWTGEGKCRVFTDFPSHQSRPQKSGSDRLAMARPHLRFQGGFPARIAGGEEKGGGRSGHGGGRASCTIWWWRAMLKIWVPILSNGSHGSASWPSFSMVWETALAKFCKLANLANDDHRQHARSQKPPFPIGQGDRGRRGGRHLATERTTCGRDPSLPSAGSLACSPTDTRSATESHVRAWIRSYRTSQ